MALHGLNHQQNFGFDLNAAPFHPHDDMVVDEPDFQWPLDPAQPPNPAQPAQVMEEISVVSLAIAQSNTSLSTRQSNASLEVLWLPPSARAALYSQQPVHDSSPTLVEKDSPTLSGRGSVAPPVTIMYKRCSKVVPPEITKSTSHKDNSTKAQDPVEGPRRSARIKDKIKGFRTSEDSRHGKSSLKHVDHQAGYKGKEIALPPLPSIQDFLKALKSGMVYSPLSINQIQHTAVHLYGISAAHISEDKLHAP
ncbi:hypothetical protein GUJ93_ZPchr0008g13119 [Zizania palustris]|uniref:Uncharacterized protein n=1 Tax=Zizania palustris TaxID=103762 RepID=A0A8J5RJ13_ZIZPA|nr:hypothetical protein GUJ93_ZPchr0008g13119 [Zizania palustris]